MVQKVETKKNAINKVGIFAGSLFVAFSAVCLYSPVLGSHADSSQTADVNLSINPGIGIRVSSTNVNLNATVGSFVKSSVNVDVATNSQYGYTLTIEDKDSSSNMVSNEVGVTDVVTSDFAGNKTSSNMADNTWGFSIDSTNFYKVPVNGSPVALKRTNKAMATEYETTPVEFGAKVGTTLTAGTYSDVVVFTAYVNGQDKKPADGTDPRNPDGSEYSYDPCIDAPYVTNGIMTDPRDGTEYTVKGLKDGQCWMTQNMRLVNKTIDSSDSDLPAGMSFTVPSTNGVSDDYDVLSAASAVWTLGGYWDFGILYNYYTASAGTGGTSLTSGTAPGSICPKGWRLPKNLGDKNEFEVLEEYYGEGYAISEKRGGEPNLTVHGIMYYGGWTEISTQGGYWTSNVTGPYMAEFFNYHIAPAYGVGAKGKSLNLAVRCIAK